MDIFFILGNILISPDSLIPGESVDSVDTSSDGGIYIV